MAHIKVNDEIARLAQNKFRQMLTKMDMTHLDACFCLQQAAFILWTALMDCISEDDINKKLDKYLDSPAVVKGLDMMFDFSDVIDQITKKVKREENEKNG